MFNKTRNVKYLEWCLGIYSPSGLTRMKGLGDIKILKNLNDKISHIADKYAQGTPKEIESSNRVRHEVHLLLGQVGSQVWPDRGLKRPWLANAGDDRLEGWYPHNLYFSENTEELFNILHALIVQKCVQKSRAKNKAMSNDEEDFNPEAIFKGIPLPPDDSQDKDYREEIRITPPPTSRKLRSDRRETPRRVNRDGPVFDATSGIYESDSPTPNASGLDNPDSEEDYPILVGDLPSPTSPDHTKNLLNLVDRDTTVGTDVSSYSQDAKSTSQSNTLNDRQQDDTIWGLEFTPYSSPLTLNQRHGETSRKGKERVANQSRSPNALVQGVITDVFKAVGAPDVGSGGLPTHHTTTKSKRSFQDTVDNQDTEDNPVITILATRLAEFHEKQERKRQRVAEAIRRTEEQIKEKEREAEEEEVKTRETLDTWIAWLNQKMDEVDEDTDEDEELRRNRQVLAEHEERIEGIRASRERMEEQMREMMDG